MPQDIPDPKVPHPPADRPVDPADLNQPAPRGPFDDGESAADGPGASAPDLPGDDDRFERTAREAARLGAEGEPPAAGPEEETWHEEERQHRR